MDKDEMAEVERLAEQLGVTNDELQVMLTINPAETLSSFRRMHDTQQLDEFKTFCNTHKLKKENYWWIDRIATVDHCADLIARAMKEMTRSSQYLALLSRRLVESVRKIQRFTRRALARLRNAKRKIFESWKEAETEARKRLRHEIEKRAARLKSTQSIKLVDEMWNLYFDCWVEPEMMRKVVNSVWRTRRDAYVKGFRQWKRCAENAVHFSSKDTITMQKMVLWKLGHDYRLLNFSAADVSLTDLCAHTELFRMNAVQRGLSEMGADHSSFVKKRAQALQMRDSKKRPVSYYHALLTCDAQHFHMLLFLNQMINEGTMRIPAGCNSWIRSQANEAKVIMENWGSDMRGGGIQSARKHIIGKDGQPISRYSYLLGGGGTSGAKKTPCPPAVCRDIPQETAAPNTPSPQRAKRSRRIGSCDALTEEDVQYAAFFEKSTPSRNVGEEEVWNEAKRELASILKKRWVACPPSPQALAANKARQKETAAAIRCNLPAKRAPSSSVKMPQCAAEPSPLLEGLTPPGFIRKHCKPKCPVRGTVPLYPTVPRSFPSQDEEPWAYSRYHLVENMPSAPATPRPISSSLSVGRTILQQSPSPQVSDFVHVRPLSANIYVRWSNLQ